MTTGNVKSSVGKKRVYYTRSRMVPYVLLLPALAIIFAFMIYPIVNTFYLSMQHRVIVDKAADGFVGLENFVRAFTDDIFLKALRNSAVWTIANVVLQVMLGLALALLLNRQFKGRGLMRALAFTPWAVGGILVALIWSFMFNESVGVINDLLRKTGILKGRMSWFSGENISMVSLVIANTWRGIPFFAVSILSSLQTIPLEIYESADVDGCSTVRRFTSITLPLIKDTLILTTLLRTIWTLNVVDIIYGMTKGGPNFSTLTVPVYIMMTFNDSLDSGYSSAMAVVMMAILLVFSAIYVKSSGFGKGDHY